MWTSTHADEKMDDIKIRTRVRKSPFEKKFKILGYTFNQVRFVENEKAEEWCFLLRERKLVLEQTDLGQNKGIGRRRL